MPMIVASPVARSSLVKTFLHACLVSTPTWPDRLGLRRSGPHLQDCEDVAASGRAHDVAGSRPWNARSRTFASPRAVPVEWSSPFPCLPSVNANPCRI